MRISKKVVSLHSRESGVYVIAFSLLLLTLLGLITFLAIRPTLVKSGASQLKQKVDSLCSNLSADPLFQKKAIEVFEQKISEIKIPYVDVKAAYLVIPTYSGAPNSSREQSLDCGIPECKYFGYIDDYYSESADVRLYKGNSPDFLPEIIHLDESDESNDLKEPFWQQDINAGNMVLCEVVADFSDSGGLFNLFTSGVEESKQITQKVIRAKSVWHRPVQNFRKLDPTLTVAERVAQSGLTILVAPHMTTHSRLPRYRYQSGFEDFDPIHKTDIFASTPGTTTRQVTTASLAERVEPYFPTIGTIDLHERLPLATQRRGVDLPTCSNQRYFSDLAESMTACMNPAILVRNLFLSTIVELASRTGNLRHSTGIYMAGTQHLLRQGNSYANAPLFWSPPVEMVPKGSDLRLDEYQHPYVSYFGNLRRTISNPIPSLPNGQFTALASTQSGETDLRNGWVLPYYNSESIVTSIRNKYLNLSAGDANPGTGADEIELELAQFRKMISNQLRYCHHLFAGANATPGEPDAIDMNADAALTEFTPHASNIGYESVYDFEPRRKISPAPSSWDQGNSPQSPWLEVSGGLDAAELMRTTGSIQLCPYERGSVIDPAARGISEADANDLYSKYRFFIDGDEFIAPRHYFCRKPNNVEHDTRNNAPLDLRPDLIAALNAFQEPASSAVEEHKIVKSPGIFIRQDAYTFTDEQLSKLPSDAKVQADIALPFSISSDYISSKKEDRSMILIATHQPLTPIEAQEMKSIIANEDQYPRDSKGLPLRPIHIVYFPTTRYDADKDVTNRFRDALGLLDDENTDVHEDWARGVHTFTEISPYSSEMINEETGTFIYSRVKDLDDLDGDGDTDEMIDLDDGTIFSKFWADMLDKNKFNITERARALFYFYMLDVEHRL